MENIYLTIVLAPLVAAAIAGLFGGKIGRGGAHWVTIIGVGVSFFLSAWVLYRQVTGIDEPFNGGVYTWMVSEGFRFEIGFLVDRLTALMMTVVTFVSWMVHIYTIGYMDHDEENWPDYSRAGTNSYQRFFSYISLFTFSMLMLVMANNFLQLFFGWEAVGLVSYLLIGFWSTRESAIHANLKAFLVNRVGDFGFILGIAGIFMFAGSLDYATVFAQAPQIAEEGIPVFGDGEWPAITVICILLFIGAMGKSAQAPLHVWLPDSMEGPTPISALIHAATMVTAGIFMVARMSPLYELSPVALGTIIVIGAITAFFTGLLGVVQNDIKRVIAYSTLSQLGYMAVALGASAYAAGIFHLMTHAFFKALLFLAAGSVIIGMHHKQDMREMGGIRKYMPVTYWTCLLGALALIGFPGFSGFFSKDAIIEATHLATVPGAGLAYWSVLLGVFITALYTFRMFFLTFHGKERMDEHTRSHLKESPWVVTVPLVLLAIPSVVIGWFTIGPVLFGDYFGDAVVVTGGQDPLTVLGADWHGPWAMVVHALSMPPLYLAAGGVATAWFFVLKRPDLGRAVRERLGWLYRLLVNKYYADWLYENVIAALGRGIGRMCWKIGDVFLIDGAVVNGSARVIGWFSGVARQVQSGFLYHYAFAMIIGLSAFLGWFILG